MNQNTWWAIFVCVIVIALLAGLYGVTTHSWQPRPPQRCPVVSSTAPLPECAYKAPEFKVPVFKEMW